MSPMIWQNAKMIDYYEEHGGHKHMPWITNWRAEVFEQHKQFVSILGYTYINSRKSPLPFHLQCSSLTVIKKSRSMQCQNQINTE